MSVSLLLPYFIKCAFWDKFVHHEGHEVHEGLKKALNLVRPEGTVVLKSTYHNSYDAEMVKIVIDEIKLIGSRCGSFRPAIDLLKKSEFTIAPLISKIFSLNNALEAFDYVTLPDVVKVLIRP